MPIGREIGCFLGETIGALAWSGRLLIGPQGGFCRDHPSLVVTEPDLEPDELEQIGQASDAMPKVLGLQEPTFARRLRNQILTRIDLLGGVPILGVMLWVEDVSDLKGGAMLQTLLTLREEEVMKWFGFAHHDVRSAEWLIENTGPHLIGFPFGLNAQSAAHRTLPKAHEYGVAALGLPVSRIDDVESWWGFALGAAGRVRMVADHLPRIKDRLTWKQQAWLEDQKHDVALPIPWTAVQVDQTIQNWIESHEPPEPLPRSRPPVSD